MISKIFRYFKIYSLPILIWYVYLELRLLLKRIFLHSYSQWGEDIIIDKLLGMKNKGFYIDIGAYDPIRFSNTQRFYNKGWKGINIEPDPIRINKFYKLRPRDINLNVGVANKNGLLDFFKFSPQTLSTFSKTALEDYQKQGHINTKVLKIKVSKLGQILEKEHKNKLVDFFSIDTEGSDLEVLKSNNWKKFRPKVICIEGQGSSPKKFLEKLGYKKVYTNQTNSIFLLS
ncbi:hypothetical protein A3B39_05500 [Candidatus Daviesbacteria bacterium RIFCSPLOWO2_01_FULL_37_10]|nr:MAG: hypothetical protein A3B39_05500 [Candidatus Daviesbacteria bacterium RIFCSPLOWO2_01_FULL_37_10]